MSFLTTTQTLKTHYPLSPTITHSHAITTLQTPPILLHLDPNTINYTEQPTKENHNLNDKETDKESKTYKITNTLPLPIPGFGKTTSYTATLTPIPNGVEWDVDVAMGLRQRSVWRIETCAYNPAENENVDSYDTAKNAGEDVQGAKKEKKRCVLIEETSITGNRFLVGMVKGMVAGSRGTVHGRFERVCLGELVVGEEEGLREREVGK